MANGFVVDREALVEYRYRAVCEVLGGSPIGEVAKRFGTSRQSLDAWRKRFVEEGKPGLGNRSRRPQTSPTRTSAEVEALICDLRREHPRWGARRISHELVLRQVEAAPARATVHRVLLRNGLVSVQGQQHQRKYRRWQRQEPMHLWQVDIMGGVPLADGRQCKLVTGIDDHSRFVVMAEVVATPNARAVCDAFTAAMRRYGVPAEVLSDNGGQFTGRHVKPLPVEVLFERICRDNGIMQRLTKPRSPTTTGKIERFHKTLREELLDHVVPFESLVAAQDAIDGWVAGYNQHRPHQGIDMATPASRFRPNGPTRLEKDLTAGSDRESLSIKVIEPPIISNDSTAIELEMRVPPGGQLTLIHDRQSFAVAKWLSGHIITVWADLRTIHLSLGDQLLRTLPSRLRLEDLHLLTMRGARRGGPPPAPDALRLNSRTDLPSWQPIEIGRSVNKDGRVTIAKSSHLVGFAYAGQRITLRLDGHLMHAITGGALIGTWPCPVPGSQLPTLAGARLAAGKLPPPPLPGNLRAQRRVH